MWKYLDECGESGTFSHRGWSEMGTANVGSNAEDSGKSKNAKSTACNHSFKAEGLRARLCPRLISETLSGGHRAQGDGGLLG